MEKNTSDIDYIRRATSNTRTMLSIDQKSGKIWASVKAHELETVLDFAEEKLAEKVEYEYALQVTDENGYVRHINECDWYTKKGAEGLLKRNLEMWEWQGTGNTAKIVKRRKAGKVENA